MGLEVRRIRPEEGLRLRAFRRRALERVTAPAIEAQRPLEDLVREILEEAAE